MKRSSSGAPNVLFLKHFFIPQAVCPHYGVLTASVRGGVLHLLGIDDMILNPIEKNMGRVETCDSFCFIITFCLSFCRVNLSKNYVINTLYWSIGFFLFSLHKGYRIPVANPFGDAAVVAFQA